jgi:hypothetical protein
LLAAEASPGNRQILQLWRRAIDDGAATALLAGHLDLEAAALEFGKGHDRSRR